MRWTYLFDPRSGFIVFIFRRASALPMILFALGLLLCGMGLFISFTTAIVYAFKILGMLLLQKSTYFIALAIIAFDYFVFRATDGDGNTLSISECFYAAIPSTLIISIMYFLKEYSVGITDIDNLGALTVGLSRLSLFSAHFIAGFIISLLCAFIAFFGYVCFSHLGFADDDTCKTIAIVLLITLVGVSAFSSVKSAVYASNELHQRNVNIIEGCKKAIAEDEASREENNPFDTDIDEDLLHSLYACKKVIGRNKILAWRDYREIKDIIYDAEPSYYHSGIKDDMHQTIENIKQARQLKKELRIMN